MPLPKKPLTEYEKLRAIWYEKLKKEGFQDIETDEDNLSSWSTKFANKKSQDSWQAKEAYYRMASHFLYDYQFENTIDKVIWEYHTEAISVQDIAKILRKAKVRRINKRSIVDHNSVWAVIRRLEQAMKNMYMSDYQKKQDE